MAYRLATESDVLKKRFNIVCRQVLGTKKKHTKDVYFAQLGYPTLSTPRSRRSDGANTGIRNEEERDAYTKLYRLKSDGTRDTSFWRTAPLEQICSEKVMSPPMELADVGGEDVLFGNEPARAAYRAFRKFPISASDESSIMTIVRLDALITSVIDTFASAPNTPLSVSNPDSNAEPGISPSPSNKRAWSGLKGGTIPLDVVRRFKSLLPIAVSQVHCEILQRMKSVIDDLGVAQDIELGVRLGDNVEERLSNIEREFTIAFRYPLNGRYYISLRQDAFRNHVCCWIGSINDCYLLQSSSLDIPFKEFSGQETLGVIESDDELPGVSVSPRNLVTSTHRALPFDDEDADED